jgi:SAM-dependent methyltransferase
LFSVEFLDVLRAAEVEEAIGLLPPGAKVLELGAGTGRQALQLQRHGFDVTAIDLSRSEYAGNRVYPVIDYDGRHIPFADRSFDAVFSSNVLEHVADLGAMHAEIRRVLRPGGCCVHILPTHHWRFWTIATSVPNAGVKLYSALRRLVPGSGDKRSIAQAWYEAARDAAVVALQPRHGERGHGYTELWLFHPAWWRRNFKANGLRLAQEQPVGLFYTGHMLLGPRLSVGRRRALAGVLGSACRIFKLVAEHE